MQSDRRGFLKSGAALAGGLTLGAVTPAIGQAPGNDQTPKSEAFIKASKELIAYGTAAGPRPMPLASLFMWRLRFRIRWG